MDSARPVRTRRPRAAWLVGGALAVLTAAAPALAVGSVAPTVPLVRTVITVPPAPARVRAPTEARAHLDALPVTAASRALQRAGARAAAWASAEARNRYLTAQAANHAREVARISAQRARDSRRSTTMRSSSGTTSRSSGGGGCSQYRAAFAAVWQPDHVDWALRTASGETGGTCSLTIVNTHATCNSRGWRAVGIMQECGYSGPFTIEAEVAAAWSLCLAQIDAWGYHGYCR